MCSCSEITVFDKIQQQYTFQGYLNTCFLRHQAKHVGQILCLSHGHYYLLIILLYTQQRAWQMLFYPFLLLIIQPQHHLSCHGIAMNHCLYKKSIIHGFYFYQPTHLEVTQSLTDLQVIFIYKDIHVSYFDQSMQSCIFFTIISAKFKNKVEKFVFLIALILGSKSRFFFFFWFCQCNH